MNLSEDFWENKYKKNKTGWDLGEVSPPLKKYFDQLTDKNLKILIPGGGNSYEAEYLFKNGFKNVYVVDISKTALKNIKNRVPDFPVSQLLHANFFDLDATFDLVIEQTFFCAIPPSLRGKYVLKMKQLLRKNAKLVGLLFDAKLNEEHPPFGGSIKEYKGYFQPYFAMNIFTKCENSFYNRQGMELFIKLVKK